MDRTTAAPPHGDDPAGRGLLTRDPEVAAAALAAGDLAALPTETVYGLGADAENLDALDLVYRVKGRPRNHPVIVHVADLGLVPRYAAALPSYAVALAEAFWPGPLTLVLPRTRHVSDAISGGQDTVAVRVPDHRLTLAALARFGHGVAAPSANRFGKVSPTTAADVVADIGAALRPGRDVVLDGGPCRVGVESTIVSCLGSRPAMLRFGDIAADEVSDVTGLAVVRPDGDRASASAPRVSGSLASHYAPDARVVLVGAEDLSAAAAGLVERGLRGALLAPASVPDQPGLQRLGAPVDAAAYARQLYRCLREADAAGVDVLLAVPPTGGGPTEAVRDRLRRAAAPRPAEG